jgi:long-chain acyl-CoA synthetase
MSDTVVALFEDRVRRMGDRVAMRALAAGGAAADESLTWGEWGRLVRAAAAALVTEGHAPGEVGAVLAGNRVLWPVADLALVSAGMVATGIYPTSAPAQVRQILADCGAAVVFVDTPEQIAKVLSVAPDLPRLRTIVHGDGAHPASSVAATHPSPSHGATAGGGARVVAWGRWLAAGAEAAGRGEVSAELDRRRAALRPEDTAILIYTSGSTGEPKGACIPHRYLLASAASIRDTLGLTEADTTLSFLPFCHAAERITGLYTRILCGMEAGLVPDHTRLWEAARAYGPTLFGGLPRFYEKVWETLQAARERAGGEERARWERVLEAGRLRSRLLRTGASVPEAHTARWREEGEPLFRLVREHFGGRIRLATSGGAALPFEVAEFLDSLGLTVLGAYGLTEHLCVAFNRPHRYVFDGVGPPMPGTEVRIAEDGEILVRRGPLTFDGYLGRPEETAQSFTPDGEWLLTGDLGTLDAEGFLHVTGRKKELIALSTGKKIAPLPIEARLLEDPWISQAMLYGEGRRFVSALICLRPAVVGAWAESIGHPGNGDPAALLRHPEVLARVQAAVDRVNAGLSSPERIRRQVVLDRELSIENDELTPTMKLRRPVVAERFRDLLDALYR